MKTLKQQAKTFLDWKHDWWMTEGEEVELVMLVPLDAVKEWLTQKRQANIDAYNNCCPSPLKDSLKIATLQLDELLEDLEK